MCVICRSTSARDGYLCTRCAATIYPARDGMPAGVPMPIGPIIRRPQRRAPRPAPATMPAGVTRAELTAWATAHGMTVPARGRIPGAVRAAWEQAATS